MGDTFNSFIAALTACGPAPDRADKMMLYGRFVGAWDGTVTVYRAEGERFESSAEVHFGWALQGRESRLRHVRRPSWRTRARGWRRVAFRLSLA